MASPVNTAATTEAYDVANAQNEADKAQQVIEAQAIAQQEGENALSGMRINLGNNAMRRSNATQQAMGQIG